MRLQALFEEATSTAVKADDLKRCEYHTEFVWENDVN